MSEMAFYTVKELAARWDRRPATIRWWLLYLRRLGDGPSPEQIARGKGRWTAYRADFVAVLEARFRRGGPPPTVTA